MRKIGGISHKSKLYFLLIHVRYKLTWTAGASRQFRSILIGFVGRGGRNPPGGLELVINGTFAVRSSTYLVSVAAPRRAG